MGKFKLDFEVGIKIATLMIAALIINVVGGVLCNLVKAPVRLDAIGTMFVAIVYGPLVGGITGGMTNCILAVFGVRSVVYILGNICVGVCIGGFLHKKETDMFQIMCAAAFSTIVLVVMSTPVNLLVYDGYTHNLWGNALFDMLRQSGNNAVFSSTLGEALIDFPDSVISVLLAYGLSRGWHQSIER